MKGTYEELNKVKHLWAYMDISIEEMRREPVRLLRTVILHYYECHTYQKYRIRLVYRTEDRTSFFLGEGGRRLFEGGAYSKF